MKEKVENVRSFSIEPNICITAIFSNLKNSGKECCKMQKANNICESQIKGLTWNGASITTTLYCIVIFKILDYMLKALANKIVEQILATTRGELAFEVLTSSNSFSK